MDRLEYFDIRARAEPIRMLYALAGTEFEDDRFQFSDWRTRKPSE